jgi:hydrogenase/urease accessory protein HupE
MKKFLLLALWIAVPVLGFAHRLDEYLQASILSLAADHVEVTMRLAPGVSVARGIIATIDTNGDGMFSAAEQQAYAQRVLNDLVLKVDGTTLPLHLVSSTYPAPELMMQGTGEIELRLEAAMPAGGRNRKLTFENHHKSGISVYLVNSLVPSDNNFEITAQNRNTNQSLYQLDFVNGAAAQTSSRFSLSGFAGAFMLGLRHIAEGTDHLLFLLALLLPAPLLASARRWARPAPMRASLAQILRIVTAFTLGHSLTLALAAFGIVHLPSRPVEVLIAVSILVSAIHAIRPLFPGREPVVAALFGLIHGLAFASALSEFGMNGSYRLVSLLGFNLGIETMQIAVVAAVLPSLLLLSRTPFYSPLRIGGALFAGLASSAWIVERAFETQNPIGVLVENAARHGGWIAGALAMLSVACWLFQKRRASAQASIA